MVCRLTSARGEIGTVPLRVSSTVGAGVRGIVRPRGRPETAPDAEDVTTEDMRCCSTRWVDAVGVFCSIAGSAANQEGLT